jgi:pyrroline-5-carboxylate reductase
MIGAGNLARALAIGWGQQLAVSALRPGRARELVNMVGGRVCATNREVADMSDVIVLCHEPDALAEVANDLTGTTKPIASPLTNVTLDQLRAAFPASPLFRLMPNIATEVRQGVIGWAEPPENPPDTSRSVRELFAELGASADAR